MTLEYDDCLKRGKIKPFSRGKSLAPKELETAASDLERSKKTYKEGCEKLLELAEALLDKAKEIVKK